jgi:hypothetical protein
MYAIKIITCLFCSSFYFLRYKTALAYGGRLGKIPRLGSCLTTSVRKKKHVAPMELCLRFIANFYWHIASNEAKNFQYNSSRGAAYQ